MRRPKELFILSGPDGCQDILQRMANVRSVLAVDTETTGLDWTVDRVGSLNFACEDMAVFAHHGALRHAIRFLAGQVKRDRPLVFHHGKFDMHVMRESFGLHIPYPVHDTMIQSQLLDNRGPRLHGFYAGHGLKVLATKFVDPGAMVAEQRLLDDIRAHGGKDNADWPCANPRIFGMYGGFDAWYTLELHRQFIQRIRHWAQPPGVPSLASLYENERWLLLALRDMEARGITCDRSKLEQWREQLLPELRKAQHTLNRIARNRDINWKSTPQLRRLLYDRRSAGGLGLTPMYFTKKGKEPSTDKRTLIDLNHPIGAALLTYRKLDKLCHGDYQNILHAMTSQNLVHCTFNQNGADTGRLSCQDPNLQQQNKKSGVRGAFIPRRGLHFRMADYSQVEMRFAAHDANEVTLIAGFNREADFDTHAATAQLMFGVKTPTDAQRSRAKTMNFAILYGAGNRRVKEGLMNDMTVEEAYHSCVELGYRPNRNESPHQRLAELLRERYKSVMPAMPRATKRAEAWVQDYGCTVNFFGRHRFFEHEDEAYKAFNTKIQGSAVDQAKRGLVNVYRELQLGTGEAALLLQIHDEIVAETGGDPRTDQRMIELMEDTRTFKVPITAEMSGSRTSWQAKEKLVT